MAQLKDIKSRLQSVKSTQKITTAMMMVASAKLRKTQNIIQNLYPYEEKLSQLLNIFLSQEENFTTPFTKERPVKRVAILAFSSNTGLAGRFNDNIAIKLESVVNSYLPLGKENILIYTFGAKVAKAVIKMDMQITEDYSEVSDKPSYEFAQRVAGDLMEQFLKEEIDRVDLIYHHFKSKGRQLLIHEPFLPIELQGGVESHFEGIVEKSENRQLVTDYIIEPDRLTIMEKLIPKVLKVKLFTTHVDSLTSEHAARMTAMQIANDNADNLIEELTREYNKLRQESITNELLDIVGGSLGKY
ncbi:MAG: ATP synthase F1 subunit gamma [Fermentimonas sp.]|nr:ATP synthase F1 subunit gamma [Fermentimonas sp.]